jgi:hypothetical protein
MLELLKRNNVDDDTNDLRAFPPQLAAEKLLAGEIDAAAMLGSWDAPVVRQLAADPRVALFTIERADAYIALYPYLSKVTVPRGVGDLARDIPPAEVTLLAPKASLVVREDLHPEGIDLPLSNEAFQFYKSGQPFLQNNLPFWMASLARHLLVLLIPIVAVLYPLIRFLPALYGWAMRRRIARLYGELRFLENDIAAAGAAADRTQLVARLDELERQANQLRMPIAYEKLYLLRNQIGVVRTRLASGKSTAHAA